MLRSPGWTTGLPRRVAAAAGRRLLKSIRDGRCHRDRGEILGGLGVQVEGSEDGVLFDVRLGARFDVSSTVPDPLVSPAVVAVTFIVRAARLVVVTTARSLERAFCSPRSCCHPSAVESSPQPGASGSGSGSARARRFGLGLRARLDLGFGLGLGLGFFGSPRRTSGSGSGSASLVSSVGPRGWWPCRYPKWTAYRAWTPMTPMSGDPTRCRPTPPHAPSRRQLRPPELQPIRRRDQRMQMHPLLFP